MACMAPMSFKGVILQEMAEVIGLSGDSLNALARGEAFMIYGRRLPKDAGCVLGAAAAFRCFCCVSHGFKQESMVFDVFWVILCHFWPCLM